MNLLISLFLGTRMVYHGMKTLSNYCARRCLHAEELCASIAGFSESTGHFTQMVWAGTQLLGCGSAQCAIGGAQGYLFVCSYSPAGGAQRCNPSVLSCCTAVSPDRLLGCRRLSSRCWRSKTACVPPQFLPRYKQGCTSLGTGMVPTRLFLARLGTIGQNVMVAGICRQREYHRGVPGQRAALQDQLVAVVWRDERARGSVLFSAPAWAGMHGLACMGSLRRSRPLL